MTLAGCESAETEAGAGSIRMMGTRGTVPVVVAPVSAESFSDSYTALGNVRSNEAVDIVARVSSVVTTILFAEDQKMAIHGTAGDRYSWKYLPPAVVRSCKCLG